MPVAASALELASKEECTSTFPPSAFFSFGEVESGSDNRELD
jgi:hypothetical protein